jgi:Uma2 family endonuclease
MNALTVNLAGLLPLTDAQFAHLCRNNPDLRFERTADGALVIMPPAGGKSSNRNFRLTGQFFAWLEATGTGVGFDSSGGFILPNRAIRSPDLAWIRQEHWDALSDTEREGFLPLCPDFVVELRSPSDARADLRAKMREYIDNGARLGWLIDPFGREVEIYHPEEQRTLVSPVSLSGEDVLPGFVLDLDGILG